MSENEEYLIDNVIILHKEHIVESSNESICVYVIILCLLAFANIMCGDFMIELCGNNAYVTIMMSFICVATLVFIVIDRHSTKLTARFKYTVAVLEGADTDYIQNNYYIGEKRGKMWVVSDKKVKQ